MTTPLVEIQRALEDYLGPVLSAVGGPAHALKSVPFANVDELLEIIAEGEHGTQNLPITLLSFPMQETFDTELGNPGVQVCGINSVVTYGVAFVSQKMNTAFDAFALHDRWRSVIINALRGEWFSQTEWDDSIRPAQIVLGSRLYIDQPEHQVTLISFTVRVYQIAGQLPEGA
jgi:hypothetical protein